MPEVTCPNCDGKGYVEITDEEDRVGRAIVVVMMEDNERYLLALKKIAHMDEDDPDDMRKAALLALYA